jgi:hypothetical protein
MRKSLMLLDELFPLRLFALALGAVLFLTVAAPFAFAQDAGALSIPAAPAGLWNSLINYGLDVGGTLLAAAGSWIIAKVISLLNITDQAKRLEVEDALRKAFHFGVENAASFAYAKAGVPNGTLPTPGMIADAMFYVQSNNPDTLTKLGVDDDALERVVEAKFHALFGSWTPVSSSPTISVASPPTDAPVAVPAASPAPEPAPAA